MERQRHSKSNPQLDNLDRLIQTTGDRVSTKQIVHDWWFEHADETFLQLAQTFMNMMSSAIARQAHLDLADDIALEMGADNLSDSLGNTFFSARARGISAEQLRDQVAKRGEELEHKSSTRGWSKPLTDYVIDVIADKWGLSETKVQELKRGGTKNPKLAIRL